ncbi:MAG TPA: YdcF family protein [Dongiaceae bacterium]
MHLALLLGTAWFFGFLLFAAAIPSDVVDRQSKTDVIVVLTGGGERLSEGFELLGHGLAPRLYISGVAAGVGIDELAKLVAEAGGTMPDEATLKCCVTIDRAQNTIGNALTSAQWFAEQKIQSIRLVTANYHMNRSLLEFHRARPGIVVVPNPVFPQGVRDPIWYLKPRILAVLINEYHKYLVAALRADLWALGNAAGSETAGLREFLQSGLGSLQEWFGKMLHRN